MPQTASTPVTAKFRAHVAKVIVIVWLRLLLAWGITPVALPPRYQLPMAVSRPFWFSMAALGPTFETELRNEPK